MSRSPFAPTWIVEAGPVLGELRTSEPSAQMERGLDIVCRMACHLIKEKFLNNIRYQLVRLCWYPNYPDLTSRDFFVRSFVKNDIYTQLLMGY
ncbi:hypothetical protein ANN_22460 [Periplaneta americana]|uniref:Uncharacterized protein n=1 Tax=Periplaneta americana TaxID=6978 RepID=A0ABQ8S8G2_PERAM|nr:hypothetical protein ANN_22460 [Periplaneta americana]